MISTLWMLALAACGTDGPDEPGPRGAQAAGHWPEPELPSCDVAFAEAGETEEADTCVALLSWSGSCDEAPGELDQSQLIFAGSLDDFSTWQQSGTTFTVTDAATWAELAEGLGGIDTLPAVDFEASFVVVVNLRLSGSCGLRMLDHGWSGYRLFASFEDRSGACVARCDMVGKQVLAYSVPRERAFPLVCATIVNSCEDL